MVEASPEADCVRRPLRRLDNDDEGREKRLQEKARNSQAALFQRPSPDVRRTVLVHEVAIVRTPALEMVERAQHRAALVAETAGPGSSRCEDRNRSGRGYAVPAMTDTTAKRLTDYANCAG
jgi:hypothetical protein